TGVQTCALPISAAAPRNGSSAVAGALRRDRTPAAGFRGAAAAALCAGDRLLPSPARQAARSLRRLARGDPGRDVLVSWRAKTHIGPVTDPLRWRRGPPFRHVVQGDRILRAYA